MSLYIITKLCLFAIPAFIHNISMIISFAQTLRNTKVNTVMGNIIKKSTSVAQNGGGDEVTRTSAGVTAAGGGLEVTEGGGGNEVWDIPIDSVEDLFVVS